MSYLTPVRKRYHGGCRRIFSNSDEVNYIGRFFAELVVSNCHRPTLHGRILLCSYLSRRPNSQLLGSGIKKNKEMEKCRQEGGLRIKFGQITRRIGTIATPTPNNMVTHTRSICYVTSGLQPASLCNRNRPHSPIWSTKR